MKFLIFFFCSIFFTLAVNAQHEHHAPASDTSGSRQMEGEMADHEILMTHAFSLNLPMNRNGSGTSWLPDSSPMYMYLMGNKRSSLMIHGSIFVRYNDQDVFESGMRGGMKWDVVSMFMGTYNWRLGERGLLTGNLAMSADPMIMGGNGYPLQFQTGETYNGKRLVDRQHPHDLFSALSVGYTYSVNKDLDVSGYFGYPGEPALGPVNFMHRPSSMNNPNAPLAHHWQDATHITYGVATLGFRVRDVKLEGSLFTGQEPDEDRYNLDKASFDSYSYRVSWNLSQTWAFQFSQGFLKHPERLEPTQDVNRTTASATHSKYMRTLNWSQTLAWGMNHIVGQSKNQHSLLYENNLQLNRQAIYGRFEFVNKSSEELALQDLFGETTFNIYELTIGYNRLLAPAAPVEISLGGQFTFNFPPQELKSIYGNLPIALQIYLQLRPHRHKH